MDSTTFERRCDCLPSEATTSKPRGFRASVYHAAIAGFVVLAAACSGGGGGLGGSGSGSGGGGGGIGGGDPTDPGGGGRGAPLDITPVFSVTNDDSSGERRDLVRASVPFPQGLVSDLSTVGVSGFLTTWMPMQKWPDGSVRIAQAQFFDLLQAGETKRYEVARDVVAVTDPYEHFEWIGAANDMFVGARVQDTFGNVYESRVQLGTGEVVQETSYVRVEKFRTYHRNAGGAGIQRDGAPRDYLTSTFYATTYKFLPYVTFDWIVGNDYLGADNVTDPSDPNMHPLSSIDVERAHVFFEGFQDVKAHMGAEHEIFDQGVVGGQRVFEGMRETWLGDGQCRRFRLFAYRQDPASPPENATLWSENFQRWASAPLYPLADLETWQQTEALGLLGGPIDPPANAAALGESEYNRWAGGNHFGTWGSFGDTKSSATTGTPRNGPTTQQASWAVMSGEHRLLKALEGMAMIQSSRTYHMYGLTTTVDQDVLLWDGVPFRTPTTPRYAGESFGRAALWQGGDPYAAYRVRAQIANRYHGWNHYDDEHFSMDALFDHWTMSGDAATLDEIKMLGECLKGLMRLTGRMANPRPVRAEGWCMHSFVQAYLATQDPSYAEYARRRVKEVIIPKRYGATHASQALAIQSDSRGFYTGDHRFYMPWQHGAVLYGFLGAYRHLGDPEFLTVASDVPHAVDYAWVRNYNDPFFGFVENGVRYYCLVEANGAQVPPNHFDSQVGSGSRSARSAAPT